MSTRRGSNEGTIRKRSDGRWEARFITFQGERKSVYGKTRQETQRLLREALQQREQGLDALNERQTVGDYLTSWIASYKRRRRVSSFERYDYAVRRHLIPGLGRLGLVKLTPQQVEAFFVQKLATGTTAKTVAYCHRVLRQALNEALRLGLVHRNVAILVAPPRVRKAETKVLTEEQARQLLEAAAGDRLEAFIVMALTTAMRLGELLALTWDDVDLEHATLIVRANLTRAYNKVTREETKNTHSQRRIALSSLAVTALRQHKLKLAQQREQLGDAWQESQLVFPNTLGHPYIASNLRLCWFYPLLERAGLPRIRLHDLRHTAATLLLARGVPVKVVSEMLGHANISITLSIYAHVLPHMQEQAAQTMDDMLRGSPFTQGSEQGSNLVDPPETTGV